jgi:hypothetical protein
MLHKRLLSNPSNIFAGGRSWQDLMSTRCSNSFSSCSKLVISPVPCNKHICRSHLRVGWTQCLSRIGGWQKIFQRKLCDIFPWSLVFRWPTFQAFVFQQLFWRLRFSSKQWSESVKALAFRERIQNATVQEEPVVQPGRPWGILGFQAGQELLAGPPDILEFSGGAWCVLISWDLVTILFWIWLLGLLLEWVYL